jgi:hypothetical protein
MSSQGTVDSPQVEFIRSYIREWENMDVEKIATFLHKDLRRVTYPRSLGRSDENRDEWQHRIEEIVGLWTSCTVSHAGRNALSPALTHRLRQPTTPFSRLPEGKSSSTFVLPKR